MAPPPFSAAMWPSVELVVFDVDGTLYAQRPVRIAMARALALDALGRLSLDRVRAIAAFRRRREAAGDAGDRDFDLAALQAAAAACGRPTDAVRPVIAEWMETRPLPHVARARYPGLDQLFDRLRAGGRRIGVWSDYPARAKLDAMKLTADIVVAAADPDVARLKPDPTGLVQVMRVAGVAAERTLMIGDRDARDGEAARRAGAMILLRSSKPVPGVTTFRRYDDAVFAPLA